MIETDSNVSLAQYTTFEIGGPAEHLSAVSSVRELQEALSWAHERALRVTVLGGGSNVLIADHGVRGVVLRLGEGEWSIDGAALTAWAGCNLSALIKSLSAHGLGGWEKLAGIPGTIGGAVRGNAGAFGSEIKDFVQQVEALNQETGEVRVFATNECECSYRMSFFKTHPEWIITNIVCVLEQVDPEESGKRFAATIAERERRHIQNVRAAGSYFVNPIAPLALQQLFEKEKGIPSREGRVPAGWLIEKIGMKGVRFGGARSSPMHADYIVNEVGAATASDVLELASEIKKTVQEKLGVALKEEVMFIE